MVFKIVFYFRSGEWQERVSFNHRVVIALEYSMCYIYSFEKKEKKLDLAYIFYSLFPILAQKKLPRIGKTKNVKHKKTQTEIIARQGILSHATMCARSDNNHSQSRNNWSSISHLFEVFDNIEKKENDTHVW